MLFIILISVFLEASAQGGNNGGIPKPPPPTPPIERCTDCHCYEEVCTKIGYDFCKTGACGPDCPEDKCCCCDEELSTSCQDGACRCNNETCQNLKYCDPDRCPDDCQANHCCCEDLCPSWADCQCLQNSCKSEGLMECNNCNHCESGNCCCCKEEWPTCSETLRCKCEKFKCDEIPGYGYCDADRCSIFERDFRPGVLTDDIQQWRCPHDQCCCRLDQVTIPHACPNETMCRCTRTDCFKLGLEYCECSDCPDNYCCCFGTPIGRCSSSEPCNCLPEGKSCLELEMRYCPPDRCDGCEGYRCCCPEKCLKDQQCFWSSTDCGSTIDLQYCDPRRCPLFRASNKPYCCCKNKAVGFIDEPCKNNIAHCMCTIDPHTCWSLGIGYCDCGEFIPPHGCPPDRCCCNAPAKTCSKDHPCMCSTGKSCPELGLAYCNPEVCGPGCPPYRCCCRSFMRIDPIFILPGLSFVSSCQNVVCDNCYVKNLPYVPFASKIKCPQGLESCCADIISNNDQNMQKCSENANCFELKENKVCAELGYGYCNPDNCPDTSGSQCCCEFP